MMTYNFFMKRWASYFLFFITIFIGLDRLVHTKSASFTSLYGAPAWEASSTSEGTHSEIEEILSQKFTYLNRGDQYSVFISEDKKYVIKFLRQNKLQPKTWLAHIPLTFNPCYQKKLQLIEKRNTILSAGKMAFTHFKEETQIIYTHFNRTNHLNKHVTFTDKKKKTQRVSLDKMCFVIQKKAELIYPRITELMHQNNMEGAKQVLSSVFSLLEVLGQRGVVDNDPVIYRNFGLVNDKAIQLDIGCMRVDPLQITKYKSEIAHITSSLGLWIQSNHPELYPYFKTSATEYCGTKLFNVLADVKTPGA
jgi:hypothetical protein